MIFQEDLNREVIKNISEDYFWALSMFVFFILIFYIFQKIIIFWLKKVCKKTKTDVDNFILDLFRGIKLPFYFSIALYLATKGLEFHSIINDVFYGVFIVAVIVQIILILQKTIDYILKNKFLKIEENKDSYVVKLIGKIIKWVLWLLGILLVLSNLGINVTSLIAGMGIGGIALALAVQNILGDIFASFSIFFDKPFKEGDFIRVGKEKGTVERIGIKTTRLKTFGGEHLVIPNKNLTDAIIYNYSEMNGRRVVFSFGVAYEIETKKLEKIKQIVTDIFLNYKKEAKLERVHFKSFGDFSLNFEISYWMKNPAYLKYLDLQEKLNQAILKEFRNEGIGIAYPNQTVLIGKQPNINK